MEKLNNYVKLLSRKIQRGGTIEESVAAFTTNDLDNRENIITVLRTADASTSYLGDFDMTTLSQKDKSFITKTLSSYSFFKGKNDTSSPTLYTQIQEFLRKVAAQSLATPLSSTVTQGASSAAAATSGGPAGSNSSSSSNTPPAGLTPPSPSPRNPSFFSSSSSQGSPPFLLQVPSQEEAKADAIQAFYRHYENYVGRTPLDMISSNITDEFVREGKNFGFTETILRKDIRFLLKLKQDIMDELGNTTESNRQETIERLEQEAQGKGSLGPIIINTISQFREEVERSYLPRSPLGAPQSLSRNATATRGSQRARLSVAPSRTSSAQQQEQNTELLDNFAMNNELRRTILNVLEFVYPEFGGPIKEYFQSILQKIESAQEATRLGMIKKFNVDLIKATLNLQSLVAQFTIPPLTDTPLLEELINGINFEEFGKESIKKIISENNFSNKNTILRQIREAEEAAAAEPEPIAAAETKEAAAAKAAKAAKAKEFAKKYSYLIDAFKLEFFETLKTTVIPQLRNARNTSDINIGEKDFISNSPLTNALMEILDLRSATSSSISVPTAPVPISPTLITKVLLAFKKLVPIPEEESKQTREYNLDYDGGDPDISVFTVHVYKNTGHGDVLLGSRTVRTTDTIKSVIDSVKGANPNQRCIVTCYKNFLNSLGPKDYYVPFGNLRLKYDQVELWLI